MFGELFGWKKILLGNYVRRERSVWKTVGVEESLIWQLHAWRKSFCKTTGCGTGFDWESICIEKDPFVKLLGVEQNLIGKFCAPKKVLVENCWVWTINVRPLMVDQWDSIWDHMGFYLDPIWIVWSSICFMWGFYVTPNGNL